MVQKMSVSVHTSLWWTSLLVLMLVLAACKPAGTPTAAPTTASSGAIPTTSGKAAINIVTVSGE